ncbi:MAG: hypothetical protein HS113_28945 [Verrucomicrobiales bacterium]|nr:hypothetical protein [Verrucomicrobiales bacterium]
MSLKVIWVTFVLAAWVLAEMVQRATGRRSVLVPREQDFRPGREDFWPAIYQTMSKMEDERRGQQSLEEETRSDLGEMAARRWVGTSSGGWPGSEVP